jgi:hypothetical protein
VRKRVCILTGASRGLGLAMAQQLRERGYRLLTLARNPNPALDGPGVEQWAVDLSEPASAASRLRAWVAGLPPATSGVIQANALVPARSNPSAYQPTSYTAKPTMRYGMPQQASPRADIGNRLSGLDLTSCHDLTTTGEHLPALHLKAANELRNVRVAKGIVDLGVNAGLLRWRVSCYCY